MVSARNHHGELPVSILCNHFGKSSEILASKEYTGAFFSLLLAYPETFDQMDA